MYNPLCMPAALLKAHKTLDAAVLRLYGFPKDASEPAIVAGLMEKHQKIVSGLA
jgi:hypothetical protein